MDVVFCTDNNYVMPCGIAILSLLKNNRDSKVNIHIAGTGLRHENENILRDIVDKYNATIKFYNVSKKELDKYKLPSTHPHVSIASYIRLFLFDILPSDINKVLYLDCDILIVDDLSDLWNINIDDYSIAGVIDAHKNIDNSYVRLKYDPKYKYINAGIMLMNLKYWRENNSLNQIMLALDKNKDNIEYADQDMLNGGLHESMAIIPMRYNMHNSLLWRKFNAVDHKDEITEALRNIAIIHYTSAMKPWLKGCVHPLQDEYLKYKAMSPWKNVPITWGKLPARKKFRYYKRVLLEKLGIKKYKTLDINKD